VEEDGQDQAVDRHHRERPARRSTARYHSLIY